MNEIVNAVRDHRLVRVSSDHYTAAGYVGVALAYDDLLNEVKIGRVDRHGVYSGESVRVVANDVEILPAGPSVYRSRIRDLAWSALINALVMVFLTVSGFFNGRTGAWTVASMSFVTLGVLHVSYWLFRMSRR